MRLFQSLKRRNNKGEYEKPLSDNSFYVAQGNEIRINFKLGDKFSLRNQSNISHVVKLTVAEIDELHEFAHKRF